MSYINSTISDLLERMESVKISSADIINWGSPVPVFGDLINSKVATLGLNPSNREFVDVEGNELDGELRRFHTLKSLGIKKWSDINARHIDLISDSYRKYFCRNPYDGWFRRLDDILLGTGTSYYSDAIKACHLDLVPYATNDKWAGLTNKQRNILMDLSKDSLGLLLKNSPIRMLIVNGKSVASSLELMSGITLKKREMPSWTLPRKNGLGVKGFSYSGVLNEVSGIKLKNEIMVLGFNHNIQSSFGVTKGVKNSIKNWVVRKSREVVW